MAAETARQFEALEAQAQTLMSTFLKAGHEAVAPAIIQPAGVFLDVVGEALRARTYVFTDPDGDELCLRPDLTVPTCRLHLERNARPNEIAKYCYNGPTFRFQPQGADTAHPREFRQAGIESFGERDRERADAATLATVLGALRTAGLTDVRLRLGDFGLFRAVLDATDMPTRWRLRLAHYIWRPKAFREELKRLSIEPGAGLKGIPADLVGDLDCEDLAAAEATLTAYLTAEGIDSVGVRTPTEIAGTLAGRIKDSRSEPLAASSVATIESYLAVKAPASAAGARLRDLAAAHGLDLAPALDAFDRRLALLAEAGVDLARAEFAAEFGRTLEYYSGFVFEVIAPGLGSLSPVAGGGRYDGLLKLTGAAEDAPAVGAAIHTERLLASVTGEIL